MTNLKKNLLAGFMALLPTFGTLYVIVFVYKIIAGMVTSIIPISFISEKLINYNRDFESIRFIISLIISILSLLFLILMIFLIGFSINTFVSKKTLRYIEKIISKIPLGKSIYFSIKQIRDLIFSKNNEAYKKTILVEYPKKGFYSMGLLTKERSYSFENLIGKGEMCSLFVPTAPNPTSGYFVIAKKEECIELDIQIEETLKSIISAGAISPKNKSEEE